MREPVLFTKDQLRLAISAWRGAIIAPAEAIEMEGGASPAWRDGPVEEARPSVVATAFGGQSAAAAASLVALWKVGHCPAPLDLRLDADALAARLAIARPCRVLTTGPHLPAVEAALHRARLDPRPDVRTMPADPRTWPPLPPVRRIGPEDAGLIVFTSGTTGLPKAVRLSRGNLLHCARNVAAVQRLGPSDRVLNALSLAHVNAPVVALLASIVSGGDVVLTPRLEPRRVWRLIAEERVTWANLVPPLLGTLVRHPRPLPGPATLRFIRTASAPLAPALMEEAEERLGVAVVESYGISEAASMVTSNDVPPGSRRPGWVGRPRGVDLRIVDRSGAPAAPGHAGEVLVRGPSVMRGYIDDVEATATALRGGWLHTGDLGLVSGEGELRITGRIKELINRGGEKVPPRLVEDVLVAHPAIVDAAVLGVPDPVYGEEIKALLQLAPGVDAVPADIARFVADRLPVHCRPRTYEAVPAIPRNPSGKIARRAPESIKPSI